MKILKSINDTLNELLVAVIDGVDYASIIALETGKSIPVVHRQLETLVKYDILEKRRDGKKVVYAPRWQSISELFASFAYDEHLIPGSDDVAFKAVFEDPAIRRVFTAFVKTQRDSEDLQHLLEDFLDMLGMLSGAQQQTLMRASDNLDQTQSFLEYATHRYRVKQENDRKKAFIKEYFSSNNT